MVWLFCILFGILRCMVYRVLWKSTNFMNVLRIFTNHNQNTFHFCGFLFRPASNGFRHYYDGDKIEIRNGYASIEIPTKKIIIFASFALINLRESWLTAKSRILYTLFVMYYGNYLNAQAHVRMYVCEWECVRLYIGEDIHTYVNNVNIYEKFHRIHQIRFMLTVQQQHQQQQQQKAFPFMKISPRVEFLLWRAYGTLSLGLSESLTSSFQFTIYFVHTQFIHSENGMCFWMRMRQTEG